MRCSGYDSSLPSDEDNIWMVLAMDEAPDLLECMLSWLVSIQKLEQVMKQWNEVWGVEENFVAEKFEIEHEFGE